MLTLDSADLWSEPEYGQGSCSHRPRSLKAHPAARIRIAGNCDELGTEEYNLALGQKRAEVAKHYLVDLGISASRVDTISYGKERPVSEGHDAEAHAANRRDDAQLLSNR